MKCKDTTMATSTWKMNRDKYMTTEMMEGDNSLSWRTGSKVDGEKNKMAGARVAQVAKMAQVAEMAKWEE